MVVSITNLTDAQLQSELKRREEEKRKAAKPCQIEMVDWARLRSACQDYIDCLYTDGYVSSSHAQFIFEIAVETIFGKDVWAWVNSQ